MYSKSEFREAALAAANAARASGSPIVPEVAVAQAALESNYGNSGLARHANNLFGIKATKSWKGPVYTRPTTEYVDGKPVTVVASFRKYSSWAGCFADYGQLISRLKWYADAKAAAQRGDARGFLKGLCASKTEPGWATAPDYEKRILAVAKSLGFSLT